MGASSWVMGRMTIVAWAGVTDSSPVPSISIHSLIFRIVLWTVLKEDFSCFAIALKLWPSQCVLQISQTSCFVREKFPCSQMKAHTESNCG